jgi:hypothetical protein
MNSIAADAAASPSAAQLAALSQSCGSLWLATLSLMTAFMRQPAPAHRYLLARRIANNFATLREQECFDTATRDSFGKLAARWKRKADLLSPAAPARPAGMLTRLHRLFAR